MSDNHDAFNDEAVEIENNVIEADEHELRADNNVQSSSQENYESQLVSLNLIFNLIT